MITTKRFPRSRRMQRRGAIAVLTAFLTVALMAIAGFLLSLSYIELADAELQAATDAAARSAVVQLVATQSQTTGRAAAQDIATRYKVGGQPFQIASGDVTFGNSQIQADGSYKFQAGQSPMNAALVSGKKTTGSAAGPLKLVLGSFVGHSTFDTQRSATAMQLDYDIILVLDRSGSMGWDLSKNLFSYSGSKASRPLVENYFSPPDPTLSRWGVLASCVNEFLDVLSNRNVSARVGLVTFASDYQFGSYTSQRVTTDADLSSVYTTIRNATNSIGQKPCIGGTDIAAGLQQAQVVLSTSPNARPKTAQPTIVLFSDGIFNQGSDPVQLAKIQHNTYGIVIHSVTFGADASGRATMDSVALNAGRGLSLHADTAAALLDSFRQIANSIPVIMTK
jgi:Ca-activated chloride channel family protein